VIDVASKNIRIKPFSKQKITLLAQSVVEEKQKLLVERFAKSDSINSSLKAKLTNE